VIGVAASAAVVPHSANARLSAVKCRMSSVPVTSLIRLTEASTPPEELAKSASFFSSSENENPKALTFSR
jgi:hypothetical protein